MHGEYLYSFWGLGNVNFLSLRGSENWKLYVLLQVVNSMPRFLGIPGFKPIIEQLSYRKILPKRMFLCAVSNAMLTKSVCMGRIMRKRSKYSKEYIHC